MVEAPRENVIADSISRRALPVLPYLPVTCIGIVTALGHRMADVHEHTAALGCDLRVVGMTTYRIRG